MRSDHMQKYLDELTKKHGFDECIKEDIILAMASYANRAAINKEVALEARQICMTRVKSALEELGCDKTLEI